MRILYEDFDFNNVLQKGDMLYGFCNGFFGRESYNDKEVVDVKKDYIVVKYYSCWCDKCPIYIMLSVDEIMDEDGENIRSVFNMSFYEAVSKWKVQEE